MDSSIALLLAQDGITNGAIYALLALALVLVFTVTRIIFIPSGEFVTYGTLTLSALQLGKPPGTVGLLLDSPSCRTHGDFAAARARPSHGLPKRLGMYVALPGAQPALSMLLRRDARVSVQILLTVAIVTALGPVLYRVAYQPLAEASVLVLLIVSVAAHLTMVGLGLWFFGAEGRGPHRSRTPHSGLAM